MWPKIEAAAAAALMQICSKASCVKGKDGGCLIVDGETTHNKWQYKIKMVFCGKSCNTDKKQRRKLFDQVGKNLFM